MGRVERAVQLDRALDPVEHPGLGFAVGAILGVNLGVAEPHHHALQGPLLAFGVKPQRHRGAGAQRHQKQLIGIGAGVLAARRRRLIGGETMAAIEQDLAKPPCSGLRHHDRTRDHGRIQHRGHDITPIADEGRIVAPPPAKITTQ